MLSIFRNSQIYRHRPGLSLFRRCLWHLWLALADHRLYNLELSSRRNRRWLFCGGRGCARSGRQGATVRTRLHTPSPAETVRSSEHDRPTRLPLRSRYIMSIVTRYTVSAISRRRRDIDNHRSYLAVLLATKVKYLARSSVRNDLATRRSDDCGQSYYV